jgi:Calcineurin-like phosphoesterase
MAMRRIVRRVMVTVGAVGLTSVVATGLLYHDQIGRYASHRKGGPDTTVAWTPFTEQDPPAVHLAIAGDVGESGSGLDATAAAIADIGRVQPFDALVLLGDLAYPEGEPSKLPDTVFGPFADVLEQGASLLAVLGNHDVAEEKEHVGSLLSALDMPGRWWARTLGDVLIVGLDSNRPDDPAQLAWLDATLAAATERWRIVVLHHPPFSAGYQGSDEAVRRAFVPVFERHGVQLVLSGHDHDYQRSRPVHGVTYVVSGAAAGTRGTGEEDFTAVSYSWRHFVEIGVFPDRLVVRAVNPELRVADEAFIDPDGGPGRDESSAG